MKRETSLALRASVPHSLVAGLSLFGEEGSCSADLSGCQLRLEKYLSIFVLHGPS